MSDHRLYVHVLLDRSGSMESCRDTTIKAYNDYVTSLGEAWKTPTRLALTIFDSESIDAVHEPLAIGDVPALSRATFVPRGSTPLMDAIGQTVARIDKVALAANERVALVILTDGLENASREYTKASIKKLLEGRREDKNWLILYLGANQDAWAEGERFGTTSGHSLSYAVGHERTVMRAAARSTRSYADAVSREEAQAAASFSVDERKAAKPQGKTPKA